MFREYHRWFSPRLERGMELLEFGHAGEAVIVFPTREGRFFDYENWGLVNALRDGIEDGRRRLFCVDSIDSEALYCRCGHPWERVARHRAYERYILDEVIPLIRSRDAAARLVAHGCSIGAYHAVNIAFRHPQLFRRVVGLSGRYDLTRPVGAFPSLLDGYYDQDVYFQMPSHFIPNLTDPVILDRLRGLEITLAVGEDDAFCDNARHLSRALWDRAVPNQLAVWRGEAHRARDWRAMVPLYV